MRLLRVDEVVNGYRIEQRLGKGGKASSFRASKNGKQVFLKQYKSPSITAPWYRAYVAYEDDLRRIIDQKVSRYCVNIVEFFEADVRPPCYFQVFEWVPGGHDLQTILDRAQASPSTLSWERRLTFAKTMMAGVKALHAADLIHGDLKPANLQMLENPEIKAGYQLKLIDMDFSVIASNAPPWKGYEGDVGTQNFMSPEHVARTPLCFASDVFTCGLILYQLLATSHPYWSESDEEYEAAIKKYSAPLPTLLGSLASPQSTAKVRELLRSCLHPQAERRPFAAEVHEQLLTHTTPSSPAPWPAPAPPIGPASPASLVPKAPPTTPAPLVPLSPPAALTLPKVPPTGSVKTEICLLDAAGNAAFKSLISRDVSRRNAGGFGPDHIYLGDPQFALKPIPGGLWQLVHCTAAPAETTVNGTPVVGSVELKDGDVIAIRGKTSGKTALPMIVRLVPWTPPTVGSKP